MRVEYTAGEMMDGDRETGDLTCDTMVNQKKTDSDEVR